MRKRFVPESLYDVHCHVAEKAGAQNACQLRLSGRILCGVRPDEWDRVKKEAALWPGSIAAFGVHPWHAAEATGEWKDRLEAMLAACPTAWVGEIGVDGLKADTADMADQAALLADQLRIADRLDRPVNVHCVKAWDVLLETLDSWYLARGPRPFVVHSFSGPHQFVSRLSERGAYFSIGPLAFRHDSRRWRERAAILPEGRLLLESDAFLVPGCDAAEDVERALAWLAGVRGCGVADLGEQILDNQGRLFGHE